MARIGAETILKCRLQVREVVKAKFLRPILPAEIVSMSVSFSEEADMIQMRASFSVERSTRRHDGLGLISGYVKRWGKRVLFGLVALT